MKKFFLLIVLTLMTLGAHAQSTRTITGFVIDKYGNPIPGALVEATNGAENVTTEADGTFTMEIPYYLNSLTAKYVGMKTTKVKIDEKDKIVIVMPSKKKGSWFIDATSALNTDFHLVDTYSTLGVMFGYMGKYGGYGRILLPVITNTYHYIPTVTTGPIFGLNKKVFLYCGIGYAPAYFRDFHHWRLDYISEYYSWENTMMFEVGAMFKFNHFNFGIGLDYSTDVGRMHQFGLQLSAGYSF